VLTRLAADLLEAETWLASRIRHHGGAVVLDGAPDAEQRRERIREAILANGLSSVLVGRKNGRAETYSACFARLYQQKL
jgi:predicted kinase